MKIVNLRVAIERFLSLNYELKISKQIVRSMNLHAMKKSKQFILIEAFQTPSNRLGLSLFAPIASQHFKAKLFAYYMMPINPIKYVKEKLRFLFSIERTLGCRRFIFIGSRKSRVYTEVAIELVNSVETVREFESLEYKGIVIGDLIYDVYLRRYREPTLHLSDERLKDVISEFIQYFDALYKLFIEGKVAGVCVSHTVYLLGLPSRIAAYFNIPAFQVTGESIYRINSSNSHAYTAFKKYPEIFRALPIEVQVKGKQLARKRLGLRFAGFVGVDMNYSTVSAFGLSNGTDRVLNSNNKPHILIAIHDFYDSPHSYGLNLYPDFYQWLLALSEISLKTDYNWYIKTHPDVRGDGLSVIQKFIEENPQFKLIPSATSHHKIIEEGITVALTIFGSIAMEYPYLGKPVINASLNNPHVRYDFSISPKTVNEYETLLTNLQTLPIPNNQDSIEEYYFVHNLYMLKSWIMKDYDQYFKESGEGKNSYSWPIFAYFATMKNSYSVNEIRLALEKFLSTEDTFLSREHFSQKNSFSTSNLKEELGIFDRWDI